MKYLKILFKRLSGNWWVVRRSLFPFPEGYATYNPLKDTILDTGLTKQNAIDLCKKYNWALR